MFKKRYFILILLSFLTLTFNNCTPFNAANFNDSSNTKDQNETTSSQKTCAIEQISGSTINSGSSLEFYIRQSSPFERIEYQCNNSEWLNLSTQSLNSQFVSIPNVSAGKYRCDIRGISQTEVSKCSGTLVFEVASDSTSGSSPSVPPPQTLPPPTVNPPPPAGNSSGFASVHQLPLQLFKADYTPYETRFVGYKNQFNPTHPVTGCAMGVAQFSGQCFASTVQEGVLSISGRIENGTYGYTQHGTYSEKQFKIFIPPGAIHGGGTIYLPQRTRVALIIKLNSPPSRTAPLSLDEYRFNPDTTSSSWAQGTIYSSDAYQPHADSGEGFEKLLKGEEFIVMHTGAGVMPIFPTLRRNPPKAALDRGYWLYIRVLNAENDLVAPSFGYEVNSSTYKSWYNSANFEGNGDPI